MVRKLVGIAKEIKANILQKSKVLRNIRKVDPTEGISPVYTFYYRGAKSGDQFPIILLVERRGSPSPRFKYPKFQQHSLGFKKPIPSKAKGETYIAGLLLDTLSPSLATTLVERFKNVPIIPLEAALRITQLTKQNYRVYDTRKIRRFSVIDPEDFILNLDFNLDGVTDDKDFRTFR